MQKIVGVDPETERDIICALFHLREHKQPISKKAIAEKLNLSVSQISLFFSLGDYNLRSMFGELESH